MAAPSKRHLRYIEACTRIIPIEHTLGKKTDVSPKSGHCNRMAFQERRITDRKRQDIGVQG
ncbi:hypothetical protein J6590_061460 [Homalodisca vitripennis]|nr:hypothetical protein J6590_061460 [Homalodisca vitripennis]